MALVITAFAFSGAQAQVKCSIVKKHKKVARTPVRRTVARTETCRVVPFNVCKINPDRLSVSCYKTTDLQGLTPLNSEVTLYGPTGPVPGATEKLSRNTVVISAGQKGDNCKRDEANRATVCSYYGKNLTRDWSGRYGYHRSLPQGVPITSTLPDNNLKPLTNWITLR